MTDPIDRPGEPTTENRPALEVVEVEIGSVKKVRRKSSSHSSTSSHHHHHRHRSSRKHRRKKILKRVLISVGAALLGVIVATVGIFFYLSYLGRQELIPDSYSISAPQELATVHNDGQLVEYNGERYRFNENIANVLVLGIDKSKETDEPRDIGDNGQADVLMVAAIDTANKRITLLNIPRDVMTDVKTYSLDGGYVGLEKMQICLSYAYGDGKESSCMNSLDAVKRVFYNLPISSYFSLDMAGIADLNDAVGGVNVTSPETIGDFVKGEKYHLEGSSSLQFVRLRSREVKEANLQRNERQKVYLKAFFNKALSAVKKNAGVALDLYNVSAPYSCTDFNAQRVTYLANQLATGGSYKLEVKSVPVTVEKKDKYVENYIKEKEFYELFLSVYYEKVE